MAKKGYDKLMGARPLGRVIQQEIKKPLADHLLFGDLITGGHVKVDIADAATMLEQQFQDFPVPCEDACDANDDGKINLADAVHLLNYLFDGGPVPPDPSPSLIAVPADQGPDPTDDDLDCENGRDSCAP